MGTRKRIEITLKAKQTLVVSRARRGAAFWCLECPEPSPMMTPDEAAIVGETSTRAIYRLIESGSLHFAELENGLVLVCSNSLFNSIGVCLPRGI